MKKIYQKIRSSEIVSDLARISVIIALIMVWILIDKGNVYGQDNLTGNVIKSDLADGALNGPSFKDGDEDVNIEDDGDDEGTHFDMWPNPVVQDLVFDFEFTVKTGIPYEILDALGRLAGHGTFEPGVSIQHIDLSHLRTGMYLVRLDLGTKMDVRRILKK